MKAYLSIFTTTSLLALALTPITGMEKAGETSSRPKESTVPDYVKQRLIESYEIKLKILENEQDIDLHTLAYYVIQIQKLKTEGKSHKTGEVNEARGEENQSIGELEHTLETLISEKKPNYPHIYTLIIKLHELKPSFGESLYSFGNNQLSDQGTEPIYGKQNQYPLPEFETSQQRESK